MNKRHVSDLGARSIDLSHLSEDEVLGCLMVAHALQVRANDLRPGDRVIFRYEGRGSGWCRDVVDSVNDVWSRPNAIEIRFNGRSSLVCTKMDRRFYRMPRASGAGDPR